MESSQQLDQEMQETQKTQEMQEAMNIESSIDKDSLQTELNSFISRETIQNCPQRSEQWYQMRLKSFGGSEIADLMGTGKYKSQERFFKEKREKIMGAGQTHIPLQNQNIMDWGSFFEPMHREVLQFEFNTQIQETSLALGKNLLEGCHQSPDGLSVVATKDLVGKAYCDLNAWKDKAVFEKPFLKVLWEQKCPSFREPVIGHVPENYIGQIKLGLAVFDVCDLACFSDSVIRICNNKQFTTKTFNTQIIKKRRSETPDPQPLYIGYVDISKIALKLGLPTGDVSSKLTDVTFNQIFDLQRNGDICPSRVVAYDQLASLKREIADLKGTYICWKMVKLTATLVERSQFFAHLLSIFITIGHQALLTEQKLSNVTNLGKYVKTKQFPLTAENQQDSWYLQNERILIQELTNHLQRDWHSVYVLLTLLNSSKDEEFRQKQLEFVRELYIVNSEVPGQLEMLQKILNDVYGSENTFIQQVIQSSQQQSP